MFVLSMGMGVVVGTHVTPICARDHGVAVGRGREILRGGVKRFGDVMKAQAKRKLLPMGWPCPRPYSRARVRREPALSLGRLNS
jgi:hypothetical protein